MQKFCFDAIRLLHHLSWPTLSCEEHCDLHPYRGTVCYKARRSVNNNNRLQRCACWQVGLILAYMHAAYHYRYAQQHSVVSGIVPLPSTQRCNDAVPCNFQSQLQSRMQGNRPALTSTSSDDIHEYTAENETVTWDHKAEQQGNRNRVSLTLQLSPRNDASIISSSLTEYRLIMKIL